MTITERKSRDTESSPHSKHLINILSTLYEKDCTISREDLIKKYKKWKFGGLDQLKQEIFDLPSEQVIPRDEEITVTEPYSGAVIDSDSDSNHSYRRKSIINSLRVTSESECVLTEYWRTKGLHGYPRYNPHMDDDVTTSEKYIRLLPTKDVAIQTANNSDTYFAIRTIIVLLGLRRLFYIDFPDFDSVCIMPPKISTERNTGYSTEPRLNINCIELKPSCDAVFRMENGVYVVYWSNPEVVIEQKDSNVEVGIYKNQKRLLKYQNNFAQFEYSLSILIAAAQNPACKTYTFARLKFLRKQFETHIMFNGNSEIEESRRNKHRDFYNVRKVDTHIHHSASMNQKHLLRFIRRKYVTEKNEVVSMDSDGLPLTLEQVFHKEAKMSAWEASVDSLNVHALGSCFHRFDMFNLKYNPFGQPALREIFLKTDNLIKGRYLAEITQESIADLHDKKYQMVEWRLSIYGKSYDEWDRLSKWVLNNKLHANQVRWMIQVPRLYHIYRKINLIQNFGELLKNIFEPVFKAVIEPEKYPHIYKFLHLINGWDSVDDESMSSKFTTKGSKLPPPEEWTEPINPPYAYWIFYMAENIKNLNMLLTSRGMRILPFRPHCGETGSFSHLASCFLVSHGINHGIMLRKNPLLQYLYYLTQIGIAVSPLSNNALFREISKNPFNDFYSVGMNVSLSTDDPLMFHFTDEPLLEEYSCCAHIWKLSSVDLCEIARYSVLQSHFEPQLKRHWLGEHYNKSGHYGNDITKTNVPNIRLHYREATLQSELIILYKVICLRETSELKDVLLQLNV